MLGSSSRVLLSSPPELPHDRTTRSEEDRGSAVVRERRGSKRPWQEMVQPHGDIVKPQLAGDDDGFVRVSKAKRRARSAKKDVQEEA